jgi:DNA-binding CsgD family transcriptional regulator
VLAESAIADGYAALASGDWEGARGAFAAALEDVDAPDALDGLGLALWWLRDAHGAVAHRERAYAAFRRHGELARAARIALWLSREYALVWGNEAAANGWLARAERLLADVAPGAEHGWIALTRAERSTDAADSARLASEAVEVGIRAGDPDLELRALAELGLAEVRQGRVDEGLARFDEAMAAAAAGEPALETFADICCGLVRACELAGDVERTKQWSQVVDAFVRRYDHLPLLTFCRTCCADVYAATGRVDEAEQELLDALRELTAAGQRARCVNPAARLAEIRVVQGRFDEAEQLLAGFEDEPEAVGAAVALRLARGEAAAAAALLERRLSELGGDGLLAVPLLAHLVEARLSAGDAAAAGEAAEALAAVADTSALERVKAAAALARGRVATARADPTAASQLRAAVDAFGRLRLPLDAARARLELARALAPTDRELAADAARRARADLDELGATREADLASRLLRDLGVRGRSRPRSGELLSKREREVLLLLGEGLSNAEIAGRLFISPKTAEHHVGRVLRKLGLRGRAEAAAYAVRHLGAE